MASDRFELETPRAAAAPIPTGRRPGAACTVDGRRRASFPVGWRDHSSRADRSDRRRERAASRRNVGGCGVRGYARTTLCGFGGFWTFRDPPELELLYGLGRAYWGQGLATELATAIVEYGVDELHMREVRASTDPPNGRPYACSIAWGSRSSAGRSLAGATRSSSRCPAKCRYRFQR